MGVSTATRSTGPGRGVTLGLRAFVWDSASGAPPSLGGRALPLCPCHTDASHLTVIKPTPPEKAPKSRAFLSPGGLLWPRKLVGDPHVVLAQHAVPPRGTVTPLSPSVSAWDERAGRTALTVASTGEPELARRGPFRRSSRERGRGRPQAGGGEPAPSTWTEHWGTMWTRAEPVPEPDPGGKPTSSLSSLSKAACRRPTCAPACNTPHGGPGDTPETAAGAGWGLHVRAS